MADKEKILEKAMNVKNIEDIEMVILELIHELKKDLKDNMSIDQSYYAGIIDALECCEAMIILTRGERKNEIKKIY